MAQAKSKVMTSKLMQLSPAEYSNSILNERLLDTLDPITFKYAYIFFIFHSLNNGDSKL